MNITAKKVTLDITIEAADDALWANDITPHSDESQTALDEVNERLREVLGDANIFEGDVKVTISLP